MAETFAEMRKRIAQDNKKDSEEVDKLLTPKQPKILGFEDGFSTGLDLLDLACSNKTGVGIIPGHYYLLVGQSRSGKTWLLTQIAAELVNDPRFNEYRVILDKPERGSLMDIRHFFGKKLKKRMEEPSSYGPSATLEQFYDNVDNAVEDGRPFFYGLDSEDALAPEAFLEKKTADKRARQKALEGKGKGVKKGSYGTDKARQNSDNLRVAHHDLDKTKSLLFIIKQSRKNIGYDAVFRPETRSGGESLTFYATLEFWFSVIKKIKKEVGKKKRIVGTILGISIKKNRLSGAETSIKVRFYPTTGIDNTGTNIMFLIEEGHWKGSENKLTAPEFQFKGSLEELAKHIEETNQEAKLTEIVANKWHEIKKACEVHRKKRYQ